MKLLKRKEFSHMDEMAKLLKTEKEAMHTFQALPKYLKKLDDINREVAFGLKENHPQQKPHMIIHQSKIEEYIKILYTLNVHFEVPKKHNIYNFTWKSAIQETTFSNKNFYYEIAAMYYNHGVLFFNQALQQMKTDDPKVLKNALNFFRIATWSFGEIQKCVGNCVATGTLVPELQEQNTKTCQLLSTAYAYKCFYLLKPKFQDNIMMMNSLHKSTGINFNLVVQQMLQMKGKQFKDFKGLFQDVRNNRIFHLTQLHLGLVKFYQDKHEENVAGGYIGIVIGLIRALKNNQKEFVAAVKQMNDPQGKLLIDQVQKQIDKLKKLELENDEVYKCQIPEEQKLPLGEEFQQQITPKDQPHVYKSIQELQQSCRGHYSGYYKQIQNELQLNIDNNKSNLLALVEDIEKERLQVYKQNNIDVILTQASKKDQSDNSEILKKVKDIKDINGGFDGYSDLVRQLKIFDDENDQLAKDIKHIIEQDYKRDKEFQQSTGIRVLGIKDASNGLLENFQKHGVTLTALRKKDMLLFKQFEELQNMLKEIDQGKVLDDLNKMQVDLSESENVKLLIKKHQVLNNIFKMHIEPTKKEILDYIKNLDMPSILHDVFVNKRTKMEIYDDLTKNIAEKIEEFRNKIEMIRKGFVKLTDTAKVIQNELPSNLSSLQYQQKFLSDIKQLELLHSQLLNNLTMNDSLKQGGKVLQQIMSDYLLSKDSQKQEILKNQQGMQGSYNGGSNMGFMGQGFQGPGRSMY